MALSLTACGDSRAALKDAAVAKAKADQVGAALAEGAKGPEGPADCDVRERSGVEVGDRLDVALIKTDQALYRANNRTQRCAAFWRDYWTGVAASAKLEAGKR